MTLDRRSLSLALVASAFAAPAFAQGSAPRGAQGALSPADRALVERAATYLQGLTEAKARFVQTDGRGRSVTGDVYLKRPGKARFDYDPPSGLLVVSDGGVVSVQDTRLKTFDRYPLSATPLAVFLAKNIRLDQGVSVTRVTRQADGFSITARDGTKRTAGQITLTFRETPQLTLTGWTVTDAQNRQTRVQLQDLQRVSGLASSLFVLKDPRPKNVGRGKV